MKIVHYVEGRCNPDTANGVDKTIYHLAFEHAKMGHEVHMISTTDKELIPIGNVTIHRAKPIKNPCSCSSEIKALLDEIKPDFGHFHSAYVPGNRSISRELKKRGIPYTITPNGNYSKKLLHRRYWLKGPYRALFELPMANDAAFIHAINDRPEIVEYGVTRPIQEAVNGVNMPETKKSPADRDVYRELGIPDSARVLTFLGRLDIEQKGLDVLLRGYASAFKSCPNLYLVLVGPEWKGSHDILQSLAADLGIKDRLIMTGGKFGESKLQHIRGCDFFIHPSRWEAGVPFSVLEALSNGKPTLVSRDSDPLGHVEGAKAGLNCEIEEKSIGAAFEKIDRFAESDLEEMGANAATLAATEFSWAKTAAKVAEGYQDHLE